MTYFDNKILNNNEYKKRKFLREMQEFAELFYDAIKQNEQEDIQHYKTVITDLLNKVQPNN